MKRTPEVQADLDQALEETTAAMKGSVRMGERWFHRHEHYEAFNQRTKMFIQNRGGLGKLELEKRRMQR